MVPKVSEEHRSRRREQILDAARECFIRKGFHQTSMADVFAESGLSAGAVYVYFKGKDEIVAAIAERVMANVYSVLEPATKEDPPPSLDELFRFVIASAEAVGFGEAKIARLVPQVWAEAPRNPHLGEKISASYQDVHGILAAVIERLQAEGRVSARAQPARVAQAIFGMVLGFVVQRLVMPDVVDPESYADGMVGLLTLTT